MNSRYYASFYGWKVFSFPTFRRDAQYIQRMMNIKAEFGTTIVFQVSARAEFVDEPDRNEAGEPVTWGQLYDSVY